MCLSIFTRISGVAYTDGQPDIHDVTASDMDRRGGRDDVTQEMLDRENQERADQLSRNVSRLKNLAFDIHTETDDQNKLLGGMDADFDGTQGLLGGSMNRISNMVSSGKSNKKIMCYIILFLVVTFVLVYYIISKATG